MYFDLSKINTSKILSARKVFFIGIGGIGISALAKLALSMGMEVSGINDEESLKTLDPLRQAGVKIFLLPDLPYDTLAKEGAELYVYSDAWLYRGPEIIEKAKATGRPVLSYFEALGEFAKQYKVVAISGTHGKTTTTAMVAEIMLDAGLDPTVIVGSFIKRFDSNFRAGESEYLVVEADEYNRHFLNLNPLITIITNIEADHLDCYKDLGHIQDAFKKLISQTRDCVIYNGHDTNTSVLVRGYVGRLVDYAKYLKKVPKLLVPGEHNRMNAACALSVANILDIDKGGAQKSLSGFLGTWRRLDKKGETKAGTIIYDDYAHHPTEIRASLQGLRELYPNKKLTVVFQPHLYSRTKALFDDFAKSFQGADQVFLLPIYFAREAKDESVSSERLAMAMCLNGFNVQAFLTFDVAASYLGKLKFGANDLFVTMGAGEAYKITDDIFSVV